MRKYGKIVSLSSAVLAFSLASGGATAYVQVATDTLTYDADITATIDWGLCAQGSTTCSPSPSSSLTYTVFYEVVKDGDDEVYKWKYVYDWFGDRKALSHLIIEVSDNFTADDLISATDYNDGGLGTYGPSNSNPGMPGDMFGIKWNAIGSPTSYSIIVESWRAPMWGDFYAVDGKTPGAQVYAYNNGFGDPDPSLDVELLLDGWTADDYVRNHLMVPDTVVYNGGGGGGGGGNVPEPTSLALLGIGLAGLGMARRRLAR